MKKLILIPFLLSAFVSWGQHVHGKPALGVDSNTHVCDTLKSDTIIRSRLKCIQRFYIDTVTHKKYYYDNYKLNLFK